METMEMTTLGRTGLLVSVAGIGCGGKSRLGQSQGKSFDHSVSIVRAALDGGVNFIDTALMYQTEEIVGEAIRGHGDEVILSTKVPIHAGDFADVENLVDADAMERSVDRSLANLGVDCIDILHLHAVVASQYDRVLHEYLPRLERLKEKGKIRFTGLTERFVNDTTHEMALRAATDGHFDVLMIGLNYVNQTAAQSLLRTTQAKGIGTLCMFAVRGPLAHRHSAEAIVRRLVATGEIDPASFDDEDPLGFLTEAGVAGSLTEAAYRFCRHVPGIDVTVVGTGNRDHLVQNLDSVNMGPLPDNVLERLALIFGNVTSESAEP